MPFISCQEGKLTDIFVTESEIVDRFVGNQLWTWGINSAPDAGRLGDNSVVDKSSPVQTVSQGTNWKQVGGNAAIKTDGTLWLWGYNKCGELGTNSITDQSSPVQTVSTGNNWRQVSASGFTSGAIKTDGTLWLWGRGAGGKLGNNSSTDRSSPVQTVSSGTNWKQLSLGCEHSAAVKTDGTLWLWGANDFGRLGNDRQGINHSSPIQTISQNTNWKQVSVGLGHSASIKTDGTLWLWGNSSCGQLGTNTTITRSSPVQTISSGTNWKQVSLGTCHSAAIKYDGTLWLWGYNSGGQLGNNTNNVRSSPVQTVSTGNNWKQISLSACNSASVKTDGTLWLWGDSNRGQLGDNSAVKNRSSPVQTVSTGTNWKQVSMIGLSTAAVTFTKF